MSSDAIRRLEIQLEVHKNSLHERAQGIIELGARNNDLEAEVRLLREGAAKQQPQSKEGEFEPPAQANPTQKKRCELDRGPEPELGDRQPKRHRSNPQEVVQPSNSHHRFDAERYDGPADVRGVDGVKNGASGAPRNFAQPPGSARGPAVPSVVPGSSHGDSFGPGSRDRHRASSFEHSHPVEDPGAEPDSSYQPEDEVEVDALPAHASRRARMPSPNPMTTARVTSVESFAHGVVAEELLDSSAGRQTLGRRLTCNGNGTVVCSRDGTDILFPTRKQHPYAPTTQGGPGWFFSPILDACTLPGVHEVFVGIVLGKFKYMGQCALQSMEPLAPEEFKSLPRGTKSHWGRSVLTQKKYGPIRKHIVKKRVYGRTPDAQDIIRAYEDGEVKPFVWRMRCIKDNRELLSQATGLPLEVEH